MCEFPIIFWLSHKKRTNPQHCLKKQYLINKLLIFIFRFTLAERSHHRVLPSDGSQKEIQIFQLSATVVVVYQYTIGSFIASKQIVYFQDFFAVLSDKHLTEVAAIGVIELGNKTRLSWVCCKY